MGEIEYPNSPLRIGIDIGGVLSKYPEIFARLGRILQGAGVEIYIITDMNRDAALAMLETNGILEWLPPHRVISGDYQRVGEECKAEICKLYRIDILIDDFLGYVAVPGQPLVRLLVMPDSSRDYYSPQWVTDGTEGSFGRRTGK
jgi:hypothetical protein